MATPTMPTPVVPRAALTALVALAEAAHLAWEQARGGIVSHHLLADPTLPAIWNGWGLLVLPLLAWLSSRHAFPDARRPWRPAPAFLARIGAAALAGAALSTAFALGAADVAGMVFLGLVLSAFALRIYRGGWLLGFVLGMTLTFGAVLPTLIGGALALVSAALWHGAWPLAARVLRRARA